MPCPVASFKKVKSDLVSPGRTERSKGNEHLGGQKLLETGTAQEKKQVFSNWISQDLNMALPRESFRLLFVCEMGIRVDAFHRVRLVGQVLSILSLNLYSQPMRCKYCHPQFTDGKNETQT